MDQIIFHKYDSYDNPLGKLLEETNQDHVVKYIKRVLDFKYIFSMNNTLSHMYNERMVRFVKSELLSRTIQKISRGKLLYVNQNGYDFFLPELNVKIEFKSGIDIFGRPRSSNTSLIKLDNTNGRDSRSKVYTKTFDYLLLIDLNRAGLIKYEDIQEYIKHDGDGRSLRIPKSKIEVITESKRSHSIHSDRKKYIYIDDRLEQAMNQMIDDVIEICDNYE